MSTSRNIMSRVAERTESALRQAAASLPSAIRTAATIASPLAAPIAYAALDQAAAAAAAPNSTDGSSSSGRGRRGGLATLLSAMPISNSPLIGYRLLHGVLHGNARASAGSDRPISAAPAGPPPEIAAPPTNPGMTDYLTQLTR